MIFRTAMNLWNFDNQQLIVLATIDIIIVYFFCTLQVSYNVLTAIYIKKARGPVNRLMLWRAYLFAMAPVVYSLLPILLVLFHYNPNGQGLPPPPGPFPGVHFALILTWIHIPPIALVFCVIIAWNVICSKHNQTKNALENLVSDWNNGVIINYHDDIKEWDTHTKVPFRKVIYEWYKMMNKQLNRTLGTKDQKTFLKVLAHLEGWYIAKQRFQFF